MTGNAQFILSPQRPGAAADGGIVSGRFGLRAGWGLLLYVLFVVILVSAVNLAVLAAEGKLAQTFHKMRTHSAASAPAPQPVAAPKKIEDTGERAGRTLAAESGLLACLFLASFSIAKIERRKVGVYGIGAYRIRDFAPGAISGLAVLSLLILALRASHALVFDRRLLSGAAIFTSGTLWLATFFVVGCLEEYVFRGYLQYTLTRGLFGLAEKLSPQYARGLAFLFASVVTSFVFYRGHTGNGGENASGLIAVFLAGVVLTYALWRTGSLWWGIGFHTAWDWAQSFLYGVPDSGALSLGRLYQTHATGRPLLSGGTAGPEGSVLVIPALLLILLLIRLTPAGTQPPLEPRDTPHAPQPSTEPALA